MRDTIIYGTSMIRISIDGTAFIKEHIPVTHWKNECMTEGEEIRLYDCEIGRIEPFKIHISTPEEFAAYREKPDPKKKLKASSLFQSLLSRV